MPLPLDQLIDRLGRHADVAVRGAVRAVVGLSVRASIPGARLAELVAIEPRGRQRLLAEVVGFYEEDAIVLPFGGIEGIGAEDPVYPLGSQLEIRCSDMLLGRVLDGLGQPIDEGAKLEGARWPVMRPPPGPLKRPRIDRVLPTGIRAIDGLTTLGVGQRIGLFAGSGVGKSTLLSQIARQADVDIFVIALIGERGREVVELLEDGLGDEGRRRGVVVCATSDQPALIRMKSAYTATAIAEWFRDRGARVLLMMDSLTRFARAAREVALAAGELPARRGYPASVFAALPVLLERSGRSEEGAITAIYNVLVEGGDMEEPIADEVRGILDGHLVLDRVIGARGRWPAIDPLHSLSRVMDALVEPSHRDAAQRLREDLAIYEAHRELIVLDAYERGTDPRVDRAIERIDAIEGFLRQRRDEHAPFEQSRSALQALVGPTS